MFAPISIKWIVPQYWSQMVSVCRLHCARTLVAPMQTSPATVRIFNSALFFVISSVYLHWPLRVCRPAPPSVSTIVCLATHLAFVGSETCWQCLQWSSESRWSYERWKRSAERCQQKQWSLQTGGKHDHPLHLQQYTDGSRQFSVHLRIELSSEIISASIRRDSLWALRANASSVSCAMWSLRRTEFPMTENQNKFYILFSTHRCEWQKRLTFPNCISSHTNDHACGLHCALVSHSCAAECDAFCCCEPDR